MPSPSFTQTDVQSVLQKLSTVSCSPTFVNTKTFKSSVADCSQAELAKADPAKADKVKQKISHELHKSNTNLQNETEETAQSTNKPSAIDQVEIDTPHISNEPYNQTNEVLLKKDKQIEALQIALIKLKNKIVSSTQEQSPPRHITEELQQQILQLTEECSRYKAATKELARALTSAQQEADSKIQEAHQQAKEQAQKVCQLQHSELQKQAQMAAQELVQDVTNKEKARSSSEIDTYKKRLLIAFSEKKELEAKISALTYEKATLLARMHELSQKTKYKEQADERAATLEAALKEAKETIEKLEETKNAALKAYKEELSVSQACVIERQQVCEQEQKKNRELQSELTRIQQEFSEQKSSIQNLEQHLARRIKECSLLKKVIDDHATKKHELADAHAAEVQKSKQLEIQVEVLKNNAEHMREEIAQKSAQSEEKISALQNKLKNTQQELQLQGKELERMQKLKTRLDQLELLYSQFGQIVSPTEEIFKGFSALTKDIPKAEPTLDYHEQ